MENFWIQWIFPPLPKGRHLRDFVYPLPSRRGVRCISPISTVWAFSLPLASHRHNRYGFSSRTAFLIFLAAGTRIGDKGAPLKLGTASISCGKQMAFIRGCPSDSSPSAPTYPFIPLARKTVERLPTPEKPYLVAISYKLVGKREFWIGEINVRRKANAKHLY